MGWFSPTADCRYLVIRDVHSSHLCLDSCRWRWHPTCFSIASYISRHIGISLIVAGRSSSDHQSVNLCVVSTTAMSVYELTISWETLWHRLAKGTMRMGTWGLMLLHPCSYICGNPLIDTLSLVQNIPTWAVSWVFYAISPGLHGCTGLKAKSIRHVLPQFFHQSSLCLW